MADRLLYLAYLVSVFGVLLLAFILPRLEPPLCLVSDVSAELLEKMIRVEANVSRVHTFKGGSMIVSVTDGVGSLDVYLPVDVARSVGMLDVGDELELRGRVQLYDGSLELVVEQPDYLVLR